MTLVKLLERVRGRIRQAGGSGVSRDPRDYWERRHRQAGATLGGVGALGLGQDGNLADYERKWEHIGALLARLDPSPATAVLDAGCGIGWFTGRIARMGFTVEGVDFSAEAVGTARRVVPDAGVRWHVSDLHTFAPGRRYDVVVCIDVLFHVVDDRVWAATLGNLAALTAERGHLLVQEHLADQPVQEPAAAHVRRRTQQDYLDALSGWRLAECDRYTLPAQRTRKDLMRFVRDGDTP